MTRLLVMNKDKSLRPVEGVGIWWIYLNILDKEFTQSLNPFTRLKSPEIKKKKDVVSY